MNIKWCIILCLVAGLILPGCGSSNPKEAGLKKGEAFLRYLVSMRDMQEVAKEENKPLTPSVMVSVIFSDIGVSMWPRADYFPEGEAPKNIPDYPPDISLIHGNPQKPWTVSIIGDDKTGEIIISGYGDSLKKPLFEDKFPFKPKV